jgi:hypothetical protein
MNSNKLSSRPGIFYLDVFGIEFFVEICTVLSFVDLIKFLARRLDVNEQ